MRKLVLASVASVGTAAAGVLLYDFYRDRQFWQKIKEIRALTAERQREAEKYETLSQTS